MACSNCLHCLWHAFLSLWTLSSLPSIERNMKRYHHHHFFNINVMRGRGMKPRKNFQHEIDKVSVYFNVLHNILVMSILITVYVAEFAALVMIAFKLIDVFLHFARLIIFFFSFLWKYEHLTVQYFWGSFLDYTVTIKACHGLIHKYSILSCLEARQNIFYTC